MFIYFETIQITCEALYINKALYTIKINKRKDIRSL
jgi:hypothetical protein